MDLPERPKEAGKLIKVHTRCLTALGRESDRRAGKLLVLYETPVRRAIRQARPARWGLLWFFTGRRGRLRAISACNYLWDCAMLGLIPASEKLHK